MERDAGSGDLPTSNDGFYADLNGVSGDLVVRPGGFEFELEVGSGEFFPHFPVAGVAYDSGVLVVAGNVISAEQSELEVDRARV